MTVRKRSETRQQHPQTRLGLVLAGVLALLALETPRAIHAGASPEAVAPGGTAAFTTIAGACPTFSWGAVAGTGGYELVVYRLQGDERQPLRVLLKEIRGSALSWTPSVDVCFEPGSRYAWAVRALGGKHETGWSESRFFEVSDAPSLEEVETALRVLQRYLEDPTSSADARTPTQPPSPTIGESRTERSKHSPTGNQSVGSRSARTVGPGSHPREALELADPAPTLGAAAFSIDGQFHLGADSHLFKDGDSFLWEDGTNTAFGKASLSTNTTGGRNVAVGTEALINNQSGNYNVATGFHALRENTTGYANTAAGNLALRDNISGVRNTAFGADALRENTTGNWNAATGTWAMLHNTTGFANTATGNSALRDNTEGYWNTAFGADGLVQNTTGSFNAATGTVALRDNTSGSFNVATGTLALLYNTTGFRNTATGVAALRDNIDGTWNVATGTDALRSNTSGDSNVGAGFETLFNSTTGDVNVGTGHKALHENTTGSRNTAVGSLALYSSSLGSDNIALGYKAGYNTDGANNILIGSQGVATASDQIHIGTPGTHTRTFLAGIGGMVAGSSVYVDSTTARLGTSLASSRELKDEIREMGSASSGVLALRPVTFRYKPEIAGLESPTEFGLIAEEVAEVLPYLVAADETGKPRSVRYQKLVPLLLNELQKQHARVDRMERRWGVVLLTILLLGTVTLVSRLSGGPLN